MTTKENILFSMKKALLEYGLRHNLDFVVTSIAMCQHEKFSDYKIPPIRFELFNMYFAIKNRNFKNFETIIMFLNEINKTFINLIPAALFYRVIGPLKALNIYECIRVGDLKKASFYIKEYFPLEKSDCIERQSIKSDSGQKEFEYKLLKKRSHWNELILDRSQRDVYFKNEFNIQYDNNFFGFLMLKINEIIKILNSHLPDTIIDQIIDKNFKSSYSLLFETNNFNLELEDEVRVELFLDNLKLHHFHLNTNDEPKVKSLYLNKYLKKLLKLVLIWDNQISLNENSFVPQCSSQSASNNKVILEMLYMDSQLENVRLDDLDINYRIEELFELKKDHTLETENTQNSINLMTSDLITDDERELNIG